MQKEVSKNFLIYSLPNIISKILPILTLPYTTKYLGLQDYGNLAFFELCLIPFQILLSFGPGYVINACWFNLNKKEKGNLIFSLLIISLFLCAVSIFIVYLFSNSIFKFLIGSNWLSIKFLLVYVIIAAVALIPNNIFNSWVIIEKKATLSTIIKIIQILTTTFSIIIVSKLTRSYKYVIISNVFILISISFIQLIYLIKISKLNFEKKWYNLIFRICSPILLRSSFNILRTQLDKIFISNMFGVGQIAIYSFSNRFNSSLNELIDNFQSSYDPLLYKNMESIKNHLEVLRKTLFLGGYLVISASLFLFFFGENIINYLTNNLFVDSFNLILMFTCVVVVTIPFMGNGQVLIYFKKTWYLFYITLIQTLTILLLSILLIPKFGPLGAIISLWFGSLFYLLLTNFKKRKLIKEKFIEYTFLPYTFIYHFSVLLYFFNYILLSKIILLIIFLILTIHVYLSNKILIKFIFINHFLKKIIKNKQY
jgi:O-antigen/teichoic acid export membrane protein